MTFELPEIPPADDVVRLVEDLKAGLVAFCATSQGTWEEKEYRRIRTALLAHPELQRLVPDYVRRYRTLADFWPFIKAKFSTYAERRGYLAETIDPLLDYVERTDLTGMNPEFEDQGVVGQGGFGVVHRVRHRLLNMDFAVKYYAPAFEGDGGEGHLERFFQEAKMLFSLRHRSIVQIYNIGLAARRPFIVMEYFEGQTLREALKAGRIQPQRAAVLVREVADALAHAHAQNIVHRDISPRNILVAKPAKFRVIDFGLGVYIERELTSRLTRSGEAPAGGAYTCPELLSDPTIRDPKCDLYSLGAIWYEMLTGRAPVGARVESALSDVPGLSTAERDAILRLLSPAAERFSTAEQLIDRLPPSPRQTRGVLVCVSWRQLFPRGARRVHLGTRRRSGWQIASALAYCPERLCR